MLDFEGIKAVMTKLRKNEGPGKIEEITGGRKEIRYTYYLKGKMAFTFGITRSSKSKSKKFYYVPRQMGILKSEYRELYNCPWQKKDLNQKLIESGIV